VGSYREFYEIIKANAPVAYGGTKLFDGNRDYLMQIPEEFANTLVYFQDKFEERPINFLEIGTASNLTNTMFWNNLNIANNVIVDALLCPNVEKSLVGNLSFKDGTVFIIGDSTGEKVKRQVNTLGIYYDIVFCDGNHDYEYVKNDYEYYSQLVKPGGYFVFHDIDNNKMPGVRRFIEECDFDGFENTVNFKVTGNENTCGIGIYRREE
tara:strand:- start:7452 stop:8078 length:627 start_codon:yes stop_codon:yes gene_type:complete